MDTLNNGPSVSSSFWHIGTILVIGAGLRLAQDFLLAWMLPIGDFGRVATAITCATIATTVGGLGFGENSLRFVSGLARESSSRIRAFWREGNLVAALFPGPLAAGMFLLVTSAPAAEVLVTSLLGLFTSLVWFQRSILVALRHQVLGMGVAALAPGLAIVAALLSNPATAVAALIVVAVGASVAMAVGLLMVRYSIGHTGATTRANRWNLAQLSDRSQLEAYIGSSASLAQSRIDLLVVSAILGDQAAGLYAAVLRLGLGVTMMVQAIGFAYGPGFASHSHGGDHPKAFEQLLRTSKRAAAVAAPIALAIVLWGNAFLRAIGPQYIAPLGVLIAVAGARWVNAATGPVGVFLVATGRTRSYMRISVTSLVMVALGLIPAALLADLTGVALVSGLGIALQNVLQLRAAGPNAVRQRGPKS